MGCTPACSVKGKTNDIGAETNCAWRFPDTASAESRGWRVLQQSSCTGALGLRIWQNAVGTQKIHVLRQRPPNATPKCNTSPTKHRYLLSCALKDEFDGYLGVDKSFSHAEVPIGLANFSNTAGLFEIFASQRLQGNSVPSGLWAASSVQSMRDLLYSTSALLGEHAHLLIVFVVRIWRL